MNPAPTQPQSNPLESPVLPKHETLVVATRGAAVESIHYGSAVLLDAQGVVRASLGDPQATYYPRSALKPLFAVGMLRAGLELNDQQLALASASHSGAPIHQQVATSTLAAANLDETALRNSTDLPYGAAERADFLAAGGTATQLAQNCSGKHAALAALSELKGWDTANYLQDERLLQLLEDTVEELTGEKISGVSTDGCGTPVYLISLHGLARGFARLATAQPGTPEARVAAAMSTYPELVAGEGRDVTALMRAIPGAVAKDGFEGIQAVALPDGTALAVKIADGGDRARMPITVKLLTEHLGASAPAALIELASSPALGGGAPVGVLTAL
ncbi:asparaginase [Arthrobacter sp. NIO-1057]|uniref:asparaginase n=1 Tax=Arthrobacter sp. NIO-1057 TaxID=993071 RepID=UPI00071CF21C|nr:asparaginase [Arthrobacter sp. NIO-1057]KSU65371.1 asparaginase [Arthrobacter sp. NIO-1057]SCC45259.1 asparaginase [Arthrobacter sp. NIO-1057]